MIKKVCFFTTNFSTHGQNRVQYARDYLPKEINIVLATPLSQNKYDLRGIKIIELSNSKLKFLLDLRKFCKENKIDLLINLGTTREGFGMLFSTFGTKTKYIVQIVGNTLDSYKIEKRFFKRVLLYLENLSYAIPFCFSKRVIFGAKDLQERTAKTFFPIKRKIKHSELVIDEKIFSHQRKNLCRKKLGLPQNKKIILFVARIEYLKGSDIMLSLIKNNLDKLFVLIGQIKDESFLNLKLPNLLLIPSINLKKLVEYFNASDLSVLPSRIEGYGLVTRESMLCGTPSIVSDIPSLRLIKHALKAKPDVNDMQKKIDEFFLMSKKEKEKLGKLGREYVVKTNSYEVLGDKLKNLLLD